MIEEGLDFLRKSMGITDTLSTARKDAALALKETDTDQIIRRSLERSLIAGDSTLAGLSEEELAKRADDLKEELFGESKPLREILKNSKDNKEFLEQADKILKDNPQLKIVKQLFKDAEQEFDGDALINKKVYNQAKKRINAQLIEAKASRDTISDPSKIEALEETIQQLKRQKKLLDNTDLYQITGRGLLKQGQPKFAARMIDFIEGLNGYSLIIGSSGMKSELGLRGGLELNQIILSGFGQGSSIVYSDPNLIATHGEIFASDMSLKAMKDNNTKVLQQMNAVINQDMLTPRMISDLRKQIELDTDGLPEPVRLAKERNKNFARQILELHEMGVGPKNSATMMNHLANYFQTSMFTMDESSYGALYHSVLPNTKRFALSTESMHSLGGTKPILGKAKMATTIKNLSDKTGMTNVTQDLMSFRLSGNRLLFGAGAVPEFFNALGGFDLDDKGLITFIKYKDEQSRERLLFSIARQPTSFQENIYARASLDEETLKHLFKEDEEFMKTLSLMADEGTTPNAQLLKTLINAGDGEIEFPKSPSGEKSLYTNLDDYKKAMNFDDANIEQAILSVYERMGRSIADIYEDNGRMFKQIEKFGSSALTSQEFKRSGLRLMEELKNQDFGPEFPQIKADLLESVEAFKGLLNDDQYSSLRNAINADDHKAVSRMLAGNTLGIDDTTLGSIRESTLLSRLAKGSEAQDILGVYVNRSMVIGSTLDQFDDFVSAIDDKGMKTFLEGDGIKLIASETAIDKTTGFALFKTFSASMKQMIDNSISSEAALRTTEKIFEGLSVNSVGEGAIKEMGKRLGKQAGLYQTAISNQEAKLGRILNAEERKELFPIMDRLLLSSRRLSRLDQYTAAQGALEGLNETEEKFGSLDEKARGIRNTLKALIESENQDAVIEFFDETFGSSTSKYARSSAVQKLVEETARNTKTNVKNEFVYYKIRPNNQSN